MSLGFHSPFASPFGYDSMLRIQLIWKKTTFKEINKAETLINNNDHVNSKKGLLKMKICLVYFLLAKGKSDKTYRRRKNNAQHKVC